MKKSEKYKLINDFINILEMNAAAGVISSKRLLEKIKAGNVKVLVYSCEYAKRKGAYNVYFNNLRFVKMLNNNIIICY